MSDDDNGLVDIIPLLKRDFVWDVAECEDAENTLRALELMPGSEEGQVREHADKHARSDAAQPLRLTLEVHAALLSDIITKIILHWDMKEIREEHEKQGDMVDLLIRQNHIIIREALAASVSQMLASGSISLGKA